MRRLLMHAAAADRDGLVAEPRRCAKPATPGSLATALFTYHQVRPLAKIPPAQPDPHRPDNICGLCMTKPQDQCCPAVRSLCLLFT